MKYILEWLHTWEAPTIGEDFHDFVVDVGSLVLMKLKLYQVESSQGGKQVPSQTVTLKYYHARTATWESPPYGTNSVCLSSISLAAEAFKSDQPTGIVVVVVATVSCCSSISSIFIICEVFILSRAVPHTEQRLAVILSPARGLSFLEANLYSSAPSVVSLVTTVRLRWGSSTLL